VFLPVANLRIAASDLDPVIYAVGAGFSAQASEPDFVVDFGCRWIVVRHI
jgi:hypothetical protein